VAERAAFGGQRAAVDAGARRLRLALAVLLIWALIAFALALQGYLTARSAGRPQDWWPSFGYSLAIFSIWAALTWPMLLAVRWIEARVLGAALRALLYAAGLAVVAAAHVGLFAALYWPLYNDGGRIASSWAMGEIMFVRNLGTNAILYAAVVLASRWSLRREQPAPAAIGHLRARRRGGVRLVALDEVEWIGAAGNHAEAHTASGAILLDDPLARLEQMLPADAFARVHRGAIVRLDRIAELRSLGRGDAEIRLRSGHRLRLSRRYRTAISAWLSGR
jgi:two-component system, LytTR family, response regulator